MNGAPRAYAHARPSRLSGARSCHAPGGVAARARSAGGRAAVCGAPASRVPVLGRFHHRRTPCLCAAGLGARHRGIVDGAVTRVWLECVTVFACFSSSSSCQGGMTGHRYLSRLWVPLREIQWHYLTSRLEYVRCLVRGCNKKVSPLLAPPLYAPHEPTHGDTVPLYTRMP